MLRLCPKAVEKQVSWLAVISLCRLPGFFQWQNGKAQRIQSRGRPWLGSPYLGRSVPHSLSRLLRQPQAATGLLEYDFRRFKT